MGAKYYEDFATGDFFVSISRTITEADIVNFACLTRDFHPVHVDKEFSKTCIFGERVAHGLLGVTFAVGLINDWEYRATTNMAFIHTSFDFLSPIKIGDTIHAKATVREKREWKRPNRGVIVFAIEIVNQNGKILARGEMHELIDKRH